MSCQAPHSVSRDYPTLLPITTQMVFSIREICSQSLPPLCLHVNAIEKPGSQRHSQCKSSRNCCTTLSPTPGEITTIHFMMNFSVPSRQFTLFVLNLHSFIPSHSLSQIMGWRGGSISNQSQPSLCLHKHSQVWTILHSAHSDIIPGYFLYSFSLSTLISLDIFCIPLLCQL